METIGYLWCLENQTHDYASSRDIVEKEDPHLPKLWSNLYSRKRYSRTAQECVPDLLINSIRTTNIIICVVVRDWTIATRRLSRFSYPLQYLPFLFFHLLLIALSLTLYSLPTTSLTSLSLLNRRQHSPFGRSWPNLAQFNLSRVASYRGQDTPSSQDFHSFSGCWVRCVYRPWRWRHLKRVVPVYSQMIFKRTTKVGWACDRCLQDHVITSHLCFTVLPHTPHRGSPKPKDH